MISTELNYHVVVIKQLCYFWLLWILLTYDAELQLNIMQLNLITPPPINCTLISTIFCFFAAYQLLTSAFVNQCWSFDWHTVCQLIKIMIDTKN